ncbi:class I tRNA ligase family protein, partial [Candidatus Kaiserbacteria bacterium]|nr:class I tRNA ligase family protein [Candidatus Kaiserbacteria bacterium]
EIEQNWQKQWKEDTIYNLGERQEQKEKEYLLVEWPYPSGNLHIGHWYAFAVPDIYVRYRRMSGTQVLFPMGFDAFGLPAENAAIKRKLDPREWTESNMKYMRGQLDSMGNAFSWDKTCNSTDPEYYKWTQWMFTQFFENDIAYRGEGIVNWCPGCNTVIANEQVQADGTCERCDSTVEKKKMPQWMLRITDFADELIDDLEPLNWPEHIKDSQRNWIGRSSGAEIDFKLRGIAEQDDDTHSVTVFTTRPDTLFGATFLAISPEKAQEWLEVGWQASDEVREFVKTELASRAKKDFKEDTEKRGVPAGITAVNPANDEEIPVWIVNYVLGEVGTGAIMAVPAHDERDFAFAKQFGIEIKQVIAKVFNKQPTHEKERTGVYALLKNEKDEYLVQHFKTPNYYWLPGGGLEEGESIEECLKRELAEETGFTDFQDLRRVSHLIFDYQPRRDTSVKFARNHSIIYTATVDSTTQGDINYTEEEVAYGLTPEWLTEDDLRKALDKSPDRDRADFVDTVLSLSKKESAACDSGSLINSGEFTGMDSEEAKVAITEKVGGRLTNTYRLRDWSIGRQRYWGVPIPIVYDPEGKAHVVPKEHLPWRLPEDVDFKPTGEAPLAKSAELMKRTEEIFGAGWTPEVETMDTFVDSSWYYLRYIDNHNDEEFSSKEAQQTWLPVDLYFGGAEHTTMHLLYSRFWQKALKRLGLTEHAEPYARRINRGLILGPDGNKMSKSKGNVIDPDEQVKRVGADTVKMYLAFMGPYGEVANYPWDMGGIAGLRRFLERVNGLSEHITDTEPKETLQLLHKTIKKVGDDILQFKFNTAISAMMVYVNEVEKRGLSQASFELFLRTLAPFAPHLTEELWAKAGNSGSIHAAEFPAHDPELARETTVTIGVQINGKVRGDITVAPDATEVEVLTAVRANSSLSARIGDQEPKKVIYVPGRILNLVIPE